MLTTRGFERRLLTLLTRLTDGAASGSPLSTRVTSAAAADLMAQLASPLPAQRVDPEPLTTWSDLVVRGATDLPAATDGRRLAVFLSRSPSQGLVTAILGVFCETFFGGKQASATWWHTLVFLARAPGR